MSRKATPARPASDVALRAEKRLSARLVRIGSDEVHYLRCYRTGRGRELALNRVNNGLYIWSEAVWNRAPAALRSQRLRRYAPEQRRISTLEANAPRLWVGCAADYWRLTSPADLDMFVDWYKTL